MSFAKRSSLLPAAIIVIAAIAAYANSLNKPFFFDDNPAILENPTIRQLWPLTVPLSPPSGWGFTVSGRPILNLSLAINYAISGKETWSYHVVNLLIHTAAGLTLFGIVRRTCELPRMRARWSEHGMWLAWAIAALWTLHPLQTESVTYIVQRAESLMGLFFFLTLYGFVRTVDSPHPRRWWAVAFVASLLGAGTKEVAALAPVMVVLYDRTFISGTFIETWRRHGRGHLLITSSWILLGAVLATTGGNRGGTVGFNIGVPIVGYWLTQFEALTRYLWLSFWPHPLVFDYGRIPPPEISAVLPWVLPVLVVVVGAVIAWFRWPMIGFLAVWFFAILAPTSVVPNVNQMIVEHRMYLPLAAVVVLTVGLAALYLPRRVWLTGACVLVVAAGLGTVLRNTDYSSLFVLWNDTLEKRPTNARAYSNLGVVMEREGDLDRGISLYRKSLELDPTVAQTHYNLGRALMMTGDLEGAATAFQEAVRILPYFFDAQLNLGITLTRLNRAEEALLHFAKALGYDPEPSDTHFHLGVALAQLGRWQEAITHYAHAFELDPQNAQALSNWGAALMAQNSPQVAIERLNEALRLRPDMADAHFNLGQAHAALGRPAEARRHFEEAVRLQPEHALARLNLGIALGQAGQLANAIVQLQEAARLRPDLPATHSNLGVALAAAGRHDEAVAAYEKALQLEPTNPQAHYNLGYALLEARRPTEAREHFETALLLEPGFTAARNILQRLQSGLAAP